MACRATLGEAAGVPLHYPGHLPSPIDAQTIRSTVDLLDLPFAFSQTSLLDESQFTREAARRGVALERGELEELHRRGVLVPFFRIHARPISPVRTAATDRPATSTEWHLHRLHREGLLADPGARAFTPWPAKARRPTFYFSIYQLLALRSLRHVQARMEVTRTAESLTWRLPRLAKHERQTHARARALAIVLEVLSTRYRPRVMSVLRSPSDDLYALVDDHDPQTESLFLQLDPNVLLRQAESLLANARHFDPLGKWHRVTRVANPRRWDDLQHDALIAQEQRVAAEVILQFLEDEAKHGRADPIPGVSSEWWEPRHERLTVDQRERAETIMDFRLSDRPAVYLAVEGQTEVTMVAKVLSLAGFDPLSSWVSVIDLEGVDRDVNLLARAVAVPRLDPQGHRGARIISPLTALMVVADPERKYASARSRSQVRVRMIEEVVKSLPAALRTDAMRRDLEYLIHLQAWPDEFEFAHFSNTELAHAVRSVTSGQRPSENELRQALRSAREARRPIKSVWSHWRMKPSKVALAACLWPVLEEKIENPRSRRALPVVDVVQRAIDISNEVRIAREMAVEE